MGITLASFQSFGKIPVQSDLLNMCVRDCDTISAAILSSLFGILSRPLDLLTLIFPRRVLPSLTCVVLNENILFVGLRYDIGSVSVLGILLARVSPISR